MSEGDARDELSGQNFGAEEARSGDNTGGEYQVSPGQGSCIGQSNLKAAESGYGDTSATSKASKGKW